MRNWFFLFLIFTLLFSCGEDKPETQTQPPTETQAVKQPTIVAAPDFNADSAYHFIEEQVAFGPRVPNTEEHAKCAEYLAKKLAQYGFETQVQKGEMTSFNKRKLNIKNIIGQFDKENTNRVLLFAHWDTRPFADRDTKNQNKPILGANDGGSGVGALLEIARVLHTSNEKPKVGIDIIFFDAEDYGQPSSGMIQQQDGTWCLGTQYWVKNQPIIPYKPRYGILLDMVGAKGAIFPKEATSMYYASSVVDKVWKTAQQIGYGAYFMNKETYGGITDDHVYVNKAGIPSIDIIHYNPYKGDFGEFHHKHDDNMDIISKETLKAVGQTVLTVIYSET